jgi:hypothetical protein
MGLAQPVVRGIEAVGSVIITYQYNGNGNILKLPLGWSGIDNGQIDTTTPVNVAGFRLDSEFLRAAQQISSSMMIPILGGGAVALTNNNSSGTLTINSTRVSTPDKGSGKMFTADGDILDAYDIVLLAQCQQGTEGGDSAGATITVSFEFNGATTSFTFSGCTIAQVSPLALAGNDAPNYSVEINYLYWTQTFSASTVVKAS